MWQIYVDGAWKTLEPHYMVAIQYSTDQYMQLGEYGNLLSVTIMLHIDIYVYRQIQHDDVYAYEPIWRRCQVPVVRRLDDRSFYWLDYCCTQKGFHKLVYAETLLRCISRVAQLDFRYLLAHLNDLGFASLQIKDITLNRFKTSKNVGDGTSNTETSSNYARHIWNHLMSLWSLVHCSVHWLWTSTG